MFRKTIVLLVLACLVLSACGGPGTAPPEEGAAEEEVAEEVTTEEETEESEIVEITILAESIPAGLDTDGPTISVPSTQEGMTQLVEPLIRYARKGVNDDGVGLLDYESFEPALAESWEFDEDTLTWTFYLRKDVVGCDGRTFTADDVIYTFARGKSLTGQATLSWFLPNVASIDGFDRSVFEGNTELGDEVVKVDDYTVKIRQSDPNKLFLPVMTMFFMAPLDKETMEAHATADDPWSHEWNNNNDKPGFGPYCVESWTKDKEFIVRANPNYYRGKPPIDRIVYVKVPESSNRMAALRSGDAHLVERLTSKQYDALNGEEGVTVAGVTGNENLFIVMNFKTPPWDNELVRKAVAFATPYDEVIETAYYGSATKWDAHMPSTYPAYIKPSVQYEHDPDKARELLAEAGYPNGEGLEEFSESFLLTYPVEKEAELGPVANILSTALRDIGMPVQLDPQPQAQYADRMQIKKDLPFGLNDQQKPIVVDCGYAMQLFYVSTEEGGLNNLINYENSYFDDLFKQMKVEPDTAKRNEMLAELQEILHEDLVWGVVAERKTQYAFSSDLTGITYYPDNTIRWADLNLEQ